MKFFKNIINESRSEQDGIFFDKIQKIIKVKPSHLQIYQQAFTHASARCEVHDGGFAYILLACIYRCVGGFLRGVAQPVAITALLTLFLEISAIAWACIVREQTKAGGIFAPDRNSRLPTR